MRSRRRHLGRLPLLAAIGTPLAVLSVGSPALAASSQPPAVKPQAGPHASSKTTGSGDFVHGVLPPPPPGSTTTYNIAAEPQIRSDPAGNFYISSENGVGAGTDAWKSTDNGLAYSALAQPNAVSTAGASSTSGVAPGGGDTDLATAPVKNASTSNAQYNVYVASLTAANVTISASINGGLTWQKNVLSATMPGDDREWIAAYGPSTYYLSYHNLSTGDQIIVNQGTLVNGVPTTVQTYSAINPAQTTIYAGTYLDNEVGNLAVDQRTGDVYQVFAGCPPQATSLATCPDLNTVYMAVGTPTGAGTTGLPVLSFTDYIVYRSPTPAVTLSNNFTNVAVDSAGNVYAAWSNDHGVFVSYSTDHGQTWSAPMQVSSGTATTAIYPWMTAGAPGKVDIVYYGTPASANFQTCAQHTAKYTCQDEPWYVFFSQDLKVLSGGKWTQEQVTPVVHYGGVCQGGVSCTATGNDNRDLYDDFGVSASPTTGLASITYSDDQYADNVGTANAGECTSTQNNTVSCDHTDFATQTAGFPIYTVK